MALTSQIGIRIRQIKSITLRFQLNESLRREANEREDIGPKFVYGRHHGCWRVGNWTCGRP